MENFYIWHENGLCDNKTTNIKEAKAIRDQFLKEGIDSYITDKNNLILEVIA